MPRFVPFFAIALLAGLIGCGGGGTDGTSLTTTGTTGVTTSTGDVRPAAGTYTATLSGTDNATAAGTYTGTGGTVTVGSDGSISLPLTVAKNGGTPTSRTLSVAVTAAGVVTGTFTLGADEILTATGTLTDNANGTYLLTVATTAGGVTETDSITLTGVLPTSGRYSGSLSGTDNQGATYSGIASGTLASSGALSASVSSGRRVGGATLTKSGTLTGTLAAGGAFSGTLDLGSGTLNTPIAATGTYTLSGSVLTLQITYVDSTTFSSGTNPTVTETLSLTKG